MANNAENSDGKSKLIAVTGPTGSGKTTFINHVCKSRLAVGLTLESCTDKVQVAHCEIEHQKVTLIDTPGFDNTEKSQADVLREVAEFLEKTYEKGRTLAGIIYMHRISENRMGGISKENFRLFEKICGKDAMKNVVIATTMWDEVSHEVGEMREQELASKPVFFQQALSHGARMFRQDNSFTSAVTLVRQLLHNPAFVLQMQREIVDERKVLQDTEAGIELQATLFRHAERHRQLLFDLQSTVDAALTGKGGLKEWKAASKSVRKQLKRIEAELDKLSKEPSKTRWPGFFKSDLTDCLDIRSLD